MCWLALSPAAAAPPTAPGQSSVNELKMEGKGINDWLMRMHDASRKRTYIGTFVVSSAGVMSSARIWHACQGDQQVERVDILTGPARSVFRHNDQVLTVLPESRVILSEKRESLGLFPGFLMSADSSISEFYTAKPGGTERVAGVEADIVQLLPKDNLRFGYRIWAEQKSGLVVKMQTLDTEGKVLEQSAFSELQLDAPVKIDKLVQMMARLEGQRVEKPLLLKTTPGAEGWALKAQVPGFKPMSCYKRPLVQASQGASPQATTGSAGSEPMQCIFSDGLASVSIFLEPHDKQRHGAESSVSLGATQTLNRRIDGYWLTAMGEVPLATLRQFGGNLERKK